MNISTCIDIWVLVKHTAMSTVHIFVKAFKPCAKANFKFKESEEAQGGNMSTLAADSVFRELSDPENSGAGSP